MTLNLRSSATSVKLKSDVTLAVVPLLAMVPLWLVEFKPEAGLRDAEGLKLGILDGPMDGRVEVHPLVTVAVSVRVLVSV